MLMFYLDSGWYFVSYLKQNKFEISLNVAYTSLTKAKFSIFKVELFYIFNELGDFSNYNLF